MNHDARTTRTSLAIMSLVLALVWGAAGCGGSGSSGFDAVSSASSAIAQAIDGQECVAFGMQTYCASGVEAATPEFEGASVVIRQPKDPLLCDEETPGVACTAALDFTTEGFNVVNSLLAAVAIDENGPWELVSLEATDDVGERRVTIHVPPDPPGASDGDEPSPFIAAVLVYAGVPPEDLPDTAESLADFGVQLVYVSRRLEIVVPAGPTERRAFAARAAGD